MKRILLTLFSVASLANAATKPNILFFFADDQRADTIAALGNPGKRGNDVRLQLSDKSCSAFLSV